MASKRPPKKVAAKQDTNHPIFKLAQAKWQSSGISDDFAATLLLQPTTGEETQALSPNFHPVGAVKIPYFDLDGKPTEFFRIRYLEPLPGFAGLVEKPQRYAQPTGTLNEVYFPPVMEAGVSWRDVAEDPNVTIVVTEGEFKAACACVAGLACFGLGGVDVWRSKKRGITLLPALREIVWKNRNVIIVFDSDAASNPNVVRAQRQLAAALIGEGALPAVASIPPRSDGSKQGLDDLIVAQGPDALMQIVSEAPAFPEADALWEMNEEVLYVRDPGLIVVKEEGRKIEPGRFVAHAYANRHYVEAQQTKDGGTVFKRKPLAPRWVAWEGRDEVQKIVYEPGKPRLVDGCWNAWAGWGVEPQKGDVTPWKWLLAHVLKGATPEVVKWFEQWCAYPIQNPGVKLYSSALLWSVEHGTGKSLLAYMLKAIYGENAIEVDSDALRGSFNAWAENKQFVIGDEITAGEARLDKDKLKSLITRPIIRINQKFMPEYTVRDCVNYIFTSNAPDALFVEDHDRRYFIYEVTAGRAEREFYERCDRWLNGSAPNSGKGPGPAILFDHLLHVDLTGFNPRESPPTTASKIAMTMNSKSDLGMWVTQLREDPKTMLRPLTGVLGEKTIEECDLFPPNILLRAYDPDQHKKVSPPGMARELMRGGFRQVNKAVPVRTKSGLVRLYAIRNYEKWADAKPKVLAEHFDSFFGGSKYA